MASEFGLGDDEKFGFGTDENPIDFLGQKSPIASAEEAQN